MLGGRYGRRAQHIALAAALGLSGCEDRREGVAIQDGQALDCSKGFAALVVEIEARPGIRDWGYDDTPTHLYQDDARETLFLVTTPSHPAHPAIIERQVGVSAAGVFLITGGCAFGDRQALDEDLRRYALLDAALSTETRCFECTDQRTSPSLDRQTAPPPP